MAFSRGAHDDATTPALGHFVGHQGGLEVVEAESTFGPVVLPVAVVVSVTPTAAKFVTDLSDIRDDGYHWRGSIELQHSTRTQIVFDSFLKRCDGFVFRPFSRPIPYTFCRL